MIKLMAPMPSRRLGASTPSLLVLVKPRKYSANATGWPLAIISKSLSPSVELCMDTSV